MQRKITNRIVETIVANKDVLVYVSRTHIGLELQMIQKLQLSNERKIFPIGQISLHLPHLLHLSRSNFSGGFPVSLVQDAFSSVLKAPV